MRDGGDDASDKQHILSAARAGVTLSILALDVLKYIDDGVAERADVVLGEDGALVVLRDDGGDIEVPIIGAAAITFDGDEVVEDRFGDGEGRVITSVHWREPFSA